MQKSVTKNIYWSLSHTSLATVAILFTVAGCKPSSQISTTKSLDNFTSQAGSKLTFNSCSGSYASVPSDGKLIGTSRDIAAMQTALTAVPTELKSAFFKDLQGSIKVVKDLASACGAKSSSTQRADDLLACWRGGESGIGIYIKDEGDPSLTERNIKHSVVRMMGYVFTDVILKVKKSGGDAEVVENAALASMKKDIAAALSADTEKSKDYRIPASVKADQTKYEDAAFAEAFDSFYCSAASKSKMSASFPNTYDLFSEIAIALPQGLAGKLEPAGQAAGQVAAQSNTTKSEFALWGRWGWGNGPVRQAFSNWGSYRANGGGFMNFRRWGNGGGFFFQ